MKAILGLALCLLLLLVPNVKAETVEERFPTSNTTITAGWNNPEKAYAYDVDWTISNSLDAEQEYSGFGFNLDDSATIGRVAARSILSILLMDSADNLVYMYLYVKVWNGSEWLPFNLFEQVGSYTLISSLGGLVEQPIEVDITSAITDFSILNDLKVRLWGIVFVYSDPYREPDLVELSVDFVSVIVAYDDSSVFDAASALAGFLLLGLPLFTIVLCLKERDVNHHRDEYKELAEKYNSLLGDEEE